MYPPSPLTNAPPKGDTPSPWGNPHDLYVTNDDELRATVFNALTNVIVTVRGRFRGLDGLTRPFAEVFTPTSDRVATTRTVRLSEGWLLGVQVFISSGAPLTGQTFARLSLIRGEGTAALELATLAAGYVTAQQSMAWPGSPVMNSLDGGGALRSITGSTPGAGAEISETVPTGARWALINVGTLLTTSATVANRTPNVLLDDGANFLYQQSIATNVQASQAQKVSWAAGGVNIAGVTPNGMTGNLPAELRLGAGYRIRTFTNAIQVGDQWSAPQMLVKEWIEGA